MRRLFLQSVLALTLFSSCSGVAPAQKVVASPSNRPPPELTRASAMRMTTAQVARLLLPGVPAGRFVGHEVGGLGAHGEPMGDIDFFHRSTPIGTDLCRREVTSALFQPDGIWEPGRDSPVRFTRAAANVHVAVAPRCRSKPGASFALVQPKEDQALAVKALRRLVAIQKVARAGGRLPNIDCTSEFDSKDCANPARTIAALPLDRISIIEGRQTRLDFAMMPEGPDKPNWKVSLPLEEATGEAIVMHWGYPPPF